MASNNTTTVEGVYAAFARGDIPFVMGVFDPQIEWREAENFLYADGNPYIGMDAILKGVFGRLGTEWEGFSAIPQEILDAGDAVVSCGRYQATYKANGAKVDAQFVHVFKFKAGKISSFQQYTDTAQFRDVVGRGRSASA